MKNSLGSGVKNGRPPSRTLVIDVGGSNVKILSTNGKNARKFASGPKMTAKEMVAEVLKLAEGWKYDVFQSVIRALCFTAVRCQSHTSLGVAGLVLTSVVHLDVPLN
jgi:hypothetical protein